ncbi:uncharacterized protein LOC135110379 isoform X2 [Scylla paramamosain]|uniref:uncharacterized protein LOC135110379 isoform X2 n=1 Tax=Scylla paramamosain TaxID=85552 RepID=UPI0030837A5D
MRNVATLYINTDTYTALTRGASHSKPPAVECLAATPPLASQHSHKMWRTVLLVAVVVMVVVMAATVTDPPQSLQDTDGATADGGGGGGVLVLEGYGK